MADKQYLDQEGLERLVDYINKALKTKANSADVPTRQDLDNYIAEATGFVDEDELTEALSAYVTNEEMESFKETLNTVYHFRGSVADLAELQAIQNPAVGDVYNIMDTGMNAAWDGEMWDDFGSIADLSDYLTFSDVEAIDIPTVDRILYGGTSAIVSDVDGLKAMLANDKEDVTVTLAENMNLASAISIPAGKNVTLDLGGNTISANTVALFANGGELVVKNGTVTSSSNAIAVRNGGTAVVDNATITSTSNSAISAADGEVIINSGKVTAQECGVSGFKNSTVTINGGILEGLDNCPMMGNGSAAGSANDGTNMNVVMNGGKLIAHIQSPGYIACGVYVPNSGSFTMNGGEVISDGAGLVMRGGKVTLNGGKIIANGATGVTGKVGDSRVVVGPYAVVYDANSKYPAMDTLELVIGKDMVLEGTDGDLQTILMEGVEAKITDNRLPVEP